MEFSIRHLESSGILNKRKDFRIGGNYVSCLKYCMLLFLQYSLLLWHLLFGCLSRSAGVTFVVQWAHIKNLLSQFSFISAFRFYWIIFECIGGDYGAPADGDLAEYGFIQKHIDSREDGPFPCFDKIFHTHLAEVLFILGMISAAYLGVFLRECKPDNW